MSRFAARVLTGTSLALLASTLTQMQTNADRASSVPDLRPAPLPLRTAPTSIVSVLVLVLVAVLVALIVLPG